MQKPDKTIAIARLKKVRGEIRPLQGLKRSSAQFAKWHRDTRIAIANVFGEDSAKIKDFTDIRYMRITSAYNTPESVLRKAYVDGLERAAYILQSMIEEVEEYWEDAQAVIPSPTLQPDPSFGTNEVFVIHGHDHGTKNTVARFLENLGLLPIILHELPDGGRTIIEKLEDHASGFAIALLTPDDVGGPDPENLRPRARQNVILELGYFVGKLGREKVRALKVEGVEIPSDFSGVLYIALEESESWKMTLIRELKSAGFEIDANRAFE